MNVIFILIRLLHRIERHRHIHEPAAPEEQMEVEEAEGFPRRWRDEEESSDEEELDDEASSVVYIYYGLSIYNNPD